MFPSLFLIVKFSDIFVDSATSIAQSYKVPKMVIALTIASFCTCAPELAISFNSILSGNADMTLANVIGSSIINVLLIIGISAIVKPIKLKERTVRKELPFLLIITTAFYFLINDSFFNSTAINSLSRTDGIILVIWFIAFCLYVLSVARKHKEDVNVNPKFTKKQSIIMTIIAIVGIIITVGELSIIRQTFPSRRAKEARSGLSV